MNTTDRKDTHTISDGSGPLCDNGLANGWYRFEGDAGTRMLSKCVDRGKCGTTYPGWLDGAHPTMEEGEVDRQVCFGALSNSQSKKNCCNDPKHIKVKNCSSYYVYKLGSTRGCAQRYCGTDSP